MNELQLCPCGLSGTGNANISPLLPNIFSLCRVTSQSHVLPSLNSFNFAAHYSQLSTKKPCISQPLPPGLAQKTCDCSQSWLTEMTRQEFARQQASLRATIPVTCKTSHILWMMELFNITGSSVHGKVAPKTLILEAVLLNTDLHA